MKSQIAAIREKLVIGATGSSASSTTSAGKAITPPTISLARPEERSTPISANPNKLIQTRAEEGFTPISANPNKLIPVTEEKPITLGGGISVTAENQPVLYSGTRRIRSVPIKM